MAQDMKLRRTAMHLSAQLPLNPDDAAKVIAHMYRLLPYTAGGREYPPDEAIDGCTCGRATAG